MSTHPTFDSLTDATGLDVIDPIETRHFSLFTSAPVDPTPADPELKGLQSALADAIDDTEEEADRLRPADLRVCVDSLGPLLDHYGTDVVRRCLDAVGGHVRNHDAMAHYVLTNGYDSDRVQALVPNADAVIELRTVDPDEYGHDAQQRWHVPRRDITTEWTPL